MGGDGKTTSAAGAGGLPAGVRLVAGGVPLSASGAQAATAAAAETIAQDSTARDDAVAATSAEPRVNHTSEPGERPALIGDYELLGEIAHGGMGVVFRARQVSLNRPVALKMILAGRLAGRAALERFRLEATAVARLEHPNIVPIYEVGQDGGQHFFSMRLLEGGSVVEHLQRYIDDPAAAALLVEKVARAIHHAHQRGILHRDLKPGNILLDSAGEPHVSDFGLAKSSEMDSGLTQSEASLGTPGFMAPEQIRGAKSITTAADIYSLGAILYQLLTGVPPFSGASPMEVLRRVTDEQPPPPRSLRPRVPRDLETICLKCLRKETHLRYASAEALADDLRRYRLGEPIEARTVGKIERLWSWCRRKPALAAASAIAITAVLTALVVLTVSTVFVLRAQTRERQTHARSMIKAANAEFGLGESVQGLLALSNGLDLAIASGATDVEASLRQHLGIWRQFVHPLCCVVDQGSRVESVSISADGKRIITGGVDQARVWNVTTGQSIGQPLRHSGRIMTVAMDATGARVITGSDDGTAIEWDVTTGRPIGPAMEHDGPIRAVAFSPDEKSIATAGDDRQARLWDAASVALRQTLGHDGPVTSVDFSVDGRKLITGVDSGAVQLWDLGIERPTPVIVSAGDGKPVRAARVGSDGQVFSATADRSHRWDFQLHALAEEHDVNLREGTHSTSISPTGLMLGGGDDSLARLWDLNDGSAIGPPIHHPSSVLATAISSDGQWLVTGCVDGSARVWRVATGQAAHSPLRADGKIASMAVHPRGGFAVTVDQCSAIIWDLQNATRLHVLKHDKPIMAAAYDPGGTTLITGSNDGRAFVWDASSGRSDSPPLVNGPGCWVDVIAMSPDGHRALTAGRNSNTALLWDPAGAQPIGSPLSHDGAITAASFDRDGSAVLTTSVDGTARLWNAVDGKAIGEPMWHDQGTVWAALFSPAAEYLVTAGQDRTVRLWSGRTGSPIGAPLVHEDEVRALAFSWNGATLASACPNGSICVWNMSAVPSGAPRLLHRFKHGGEVRAIAFSPDGRLLLAGGGDNTAQFWDVASGDPVGPPMRHDGAVIAVGFDPVNHLALTASEDGALRLWPIAPTAETAADVTRWAETTTGMTSDAASNTRWLTVAEWWERTRSVSISRR